MDKSESNFFKDLESFVGPDEFVGITILGIDENKPFVLYQAHKGIKKFILKGLNEKFRNHPAYIELLRKEFEIGYQIDHPGIVKTYSFKLINDLGYCIVMEWIDGITLGFYKKEHIIDENKAVLYLKQLCESLSYLHDRQIIHCDLTPNNILLTSNGTVLKLIDFGFADKPEYAVLKNVGGSKGFTSPEIINSTNGKIDHRADIYSLGAIMRFMLSPEQASKFYNKTVSRCLKQDPDSRFARVSDVIESLTRLKSKRKKTMIALGFSVLCLFIITVIWASNRFIYLSYSRVYSNETKNIEKSNDEKEKEIPENDIGKISITINETGYTNKERYNAPENNKSSMTLNKRDFPYSKEWEGWETTVLGWAYALSYSNLMDEFMEYCEAVENANVAEELPQYNWQERAEKKTMEWIDKEAGNNVVFRDSCIAQAKKGEAEFFNNSATQKNIRDISLLFQEKKSL